jgi:hypothetical protein
MNSFLCIFIFLKDLRKIKKFISKIALKFGAVQVLKKIEIKKCEISLKCIVSLFKIIIGFFIFILFCAFITCGLSIIAVNFPQYNTTYWFIEK